MTKYTKLPEKAKGKFMLYKMKDEEFEKVYKIMFESFPVDERRTFDEQIELLSNPLFEIFVWKDENAGDVKGFISIYRLEEFYFLEHFAVSEKYRNEEIGRSVLEKLLEWQEKVCLEVEPPVTEQARRRIEFYRRNGFYLNEYPYMQPSISKGTKSVPLMIMTNGGKIDESEFLHVKNELYSKVYRL